MGSATDSPKPEPRRRRGARLTLRLLVFNLLLVFLPIAGLSFLGPYERQLLAAQERAMVQQGRVLAADGSSWRPDPGAEVLLLGDSFTNVYSVPELGWGEGAGLAEQLAFALERPVDRIAVNAGGAWTARQRLVAELRRGSDRLAGKRLVVYEFAVRELTSGDWREIAAFLFPEPAA